MAELSRLPTHPPEFEPGNVAKQGDHKQAAQTVCEDLDNPRNVPPDEWRKTASVVGLARPDAPPSLILYAEGDSAPLQRQSQLLNDSLRAVGAASKIVIVPGESHSRMVLVLSRADKVAARAILEFVRTRSCGRNRPAG